MTRIIEYTNPYHDKVVQHILEIENDEFNLNLTLDDQPDLVSIETAYQNAGGNFWIALDDNDDVVGTIALFNLGQSVADLRKMFVKPNYRGRETGISQKLFDTLIHWAKENKYEKIFLETISVFKAAVKFYSRNGFRKIEQNQLPHNFPVIRVAEFFFVRELNSSDQAGAS